ncbi:hypothetical protein ACHAWX_004520 [Stephanocyclus meneghinianus]
MDDQEKEIYLSKKAEHRPFDFDNYYKDIQDETFKSTIIPIDPTTAEAMVSYYQQRYNHRNRLSYDDVDKLKTLRQTIEDTIQDKFNGQPVFCRMTNRSPKDGEPSAHIGELQQYYQEELNSLTATANHCKENAPSACDDIANLKMVAASAAQLRSLRCECADDVMNLLLSSERVFVDTLLALNCHCAEKSDGTVSWSTFLILREWNEGISGGEWEFRVFVHQGQVTAVSQYNHYCVFPNLINIDSDQLLDEIINYWKEVRGFVPATSYILDIVKLTTNGAWKIIELNPFATTTGAALYDWKEDSDILMPTQPGDPQFRIRRELCEGIGEYLEIVLLPGMLPLDASDRPQDSGPWVEYLNVSSEIEVETSDKVKMTSFTRMCNVL